jgi:phage terminase small subunit
MAKTGRRSAADRAVIRPTGGFGRLHPPPDLGKDEQEVWRKIVLTCDAEHFQQSDAPLLVRYVQNVVLARRAAEALTKEGAVIAGRANPWLTVAEKADRALVALSMRLRISPEPDLERDSTYWRAALGQRQTRKSEDCPPHPRRPKVAAEASVLPARLEDTRQTPALGAPLGAVPFATRFATELHETGSNWTVQQCRNERRKMADVLTLQY